MERAIVVLALGLLAVLVLAPVATMAWESVRVDYVEDAHGRVYLGQVRDTDAEGVTIRVHGEGTSRYVKRPEIAAEGRTRTREVRRRRLELTAESDSGDSR